MELLRRIGIPAGARFARHHIAYGDVIWPAYLIGIAGYGVALLGAVALNLFPDVSGSALVALGVVLLLCAAIQAVAPRPHFGSARGHLALALVYLAPAVAMAILGESASIALAATMFVGPLTAVWIADRRWAAAHLILAGAALLTPPLLGLTGDGGLAACLRLLPSMWVLGILCLLVLETAEAQGRELERLARTDALTGVGNRRLLHERLTEVQARHASTGAPYALVALDLDGFKAVNDRLGHHAGDAVLQQVATGLTGTVRGYDTVARLGGDEFIVLLPDTTAEEATRVRELLRAELSRIPIVDDALSAGLGLAACPADGTDPHDLLRIADDRLLAQKQAPRRARTAPSPTTVAPPAERSGSRQLGIDISRHALAQHRWIWALSGFMFLINALMALALRWQAPELTTWALPWVAAWGLAVSAVVLLTRPPRIGTRANHLFLLAGHVTPLGTLLACQPGGSVGIGSSIFIGPLIAARLVRRREIVAHLVLVSGLFLAAAVSGALDQTSMLAVATLVGSFWVLAVCITVVLEMAELQGVELQEAVRRDPLTGAANRRHLEEWLERELARTARAGTRVGIVAVDLDGFKQINDTAGHSAGDALLCAVGEQLVRALDADAVIARTGGDEFVVACEVRSTEELDQVAATCARALREVRGPSGPIGAGIGTACSHPDSTVDSLLIDADRQLIAAKHAATPRTTTRHPQPVSVQMWSPKRPSGDAHREGRASGRRPAGFPRPRAQSVRMATVRGDRTLREPQSPRYALGRASPAAGVARSRRGRPGHPATRSGNGMRGRRCASQRPSVLYPERMPFRLSRVALLAVLAAAATSTTAQAATFDVSRRVDPSLDRYLSTDGATTPLGEMTADQQWLAANASPLVLHDSDPRVSLNVVGWAAQPRTAVYVNGTGVNLYNPIKLRQARKWLVKRGSKRVLVDGGWQMLDLRKAAARTWWLYGADKKATCNPVREERAALDLLACGYTGLWIDNALTTPKQGFTPTPKISERSWAKGVLTLLKQLRSKMPAGKTFTINMHWTDTTFGYASRPKLRKNDPEIRAGRYADQVVIEGGAIDPGLHYPLSATTPWSYRRLLTFADAMHKVGTKLQWEKTSSGDLTRGRTPISGSPKLPLLAECNDRALSAPWTVGGASWKAHVQSAAFNFATAVLTARPGDSVGDMCEYPGRGWVGYHADLGQPTGSRKDADGILTRTLERGLVVVNPNDQSRTVSLPQPGVNLAALTYPQPTGTVSSVTLPPRSAAVIKY